MTKDVTYYVKRPKWTYPRLWREFRRCAAVAALALAQRATPNRDTRTHLMIAHLAQAMKADGEADD